MSNVDKLPEGWANELGKLYEQGASDTEIRAALKMTKSLWENLYTDPTSSSFKQVVDFGRELAKGWWLQQGRTMLMSRQFNANLWHMNMKNRYGWSDKTEVSTKAAHEMSNDQLEEAVKKAVEKAARLKMI